LGSSASGWIHLGHEASNHILPPSKTPSSGFFKDREFKLPNMGSTGIQGGMRYLALNNTELVYQNQ
jgi:hypothetical protein